MKTIKILTLITGLFLITNTAFSQWSRTGPIITWDEIHASKYVDIHDTRFVCNPSYQSVFHHFKIMNPNTNATMFAVDNDGTTHVNAELKAKAIFVQTNVWADYVFEKDYELMSLYEVEKYINSNKHLPGIPSEEEIVEGGVNVAKMNVLLMEKVEELTLHMIQLRKELDELSK